MQIILQDQPRRTSNAPIPTSTLPFVIEEPIKTPVESNTSQPPTPSSAWFSPTISFYLEPDPQKSQRVYPSGIRQIFAIWDYANMKEGLVFRREWYIDEELILAQEEKWDFSRYGSKGTISDVTIHNFEEGLEPGLYSLRLYINGQEQTLTTLKSQASFRVVRESSPSPAIAPDGSKIASSEPRSLTSNKEYLNNRVFIGKRSQDMVSTVKISSSATGTVQTDEVERRMGFEKAVDHHAMG
jgi:hypothetical protein